MQQALTMEVFLQEILQIKFLAQDYYSNDEVSALSNSNYDILKTIEKVHFVSWVWRRIKYIGYLHIATEFFWRVTAERIFGFLLCQINPSDAAFTIFQHLYFPGCFSLFLLYVQILFEFHWNLNGDREQIVKAIHARGGLLPASIHVFEAGWHA